MFGVLNIFSLTARKYKEQQRKYRECILKKALVFSESGARCCFAHKCLNLLAEIAYFTVVGVYSINVHINIVFRLQ
jgi:hypothetical protein